MTVAMLDLTLSQNCAWAASLHFTNEDGSDFDLSAGTLTGQARYSAAYSATPALTFTCTITDAEHGAAVISAAAQASKAIKTAGTAFRQTTTLWAEIDFVPTADPANPIRLAEGTLQVVPGGNAQQTTGDAPTVALDEINLVVGATDAASARKMIGVNDDDGLVPVEQLPEAVQSLAENVTSLTVLAEAGVTEGATGVLVRASEVGTIAPQNANAVAITGGTITGVTSVGIGGSAPYRLTIYDSDVAQIALINTTVTTGRRYHIRSVSNGTFDILDQSGISVFQADASQCVGLGSSAVSTARARVFDNSTLGTAFLVQENNAASSIQQWNNAGGTVAELNNAGSLILSAAGKNHVIGSGSLNGNAQLCLSGSFESTVGEAIGFFIHGSTKAMPDAQLHGMAIHQTLVKADSGNHELVCVLKLDAPTITGGAATIGETSTLWLRAVVTEAGSENYALHSAYGEVRIDDGKLAIDNSGPTVPYPATALVHIGGSLVGAAGTASIKLVAGTLLSTPEPGAIEYDGTHFYGTDSSGTRLQLDNAP